jgi:hypothetical protein
VRETIAIAVLAGATALGLVVAWPLRRRLPQRAEDALMAVAGVGIGVGGLLLQRDVEVWSWVAAPAILAIAAPLHVRALFAREGPFRS